MKLRVIVHIGILLISHFYHFIGKAGYIFYCLYFFVTFWVIQMSAGITFRVYCIQWKKLKYTWKNTYMKWTFWHIQFGGCCISKISSLCFYGHLEKFNIKYLVYDKMYHGKYDKIQKEVIVKDLLWKKVVWE